VSLARPLITVLDEKNVPSGSSIPMPAVFKAPIRPDIVNFVHQNMSKNSRQPYAVNVDAGKFVLWKWKEMMCTLCPVVTQNLTSVSAYPAKCESKIESLGSLACLT